MHDFDTDETARSFARAGISAQEAAENIRDFGRRLAEIDYAGIEARVASWSRQPGKSTLFDLFATPEWRKIGRQRARKLRRRGQHVEWSPAAGSYVWLRHIDPIKSIASQLYGIPYAQVHPHLRQSAKKVAWLQMYGSPTGRIHRSL